MSNGGWGLPLYENEYEKGDDGKWRISRLAGPFTMYTSWDGWGNERAQQHLARQVRSAAGPAALDGLPDLSGLLHRAVPLPEPGDRQKPFANDTGRVGAYFRAAGHAGAGSLAQDRPTGRRHPADRRTAQGLIDALRKAVAALRRRPDRAHRLPRMDGGRHRRLVEAGAIRWRSVAAGDWPSDGRDYSCAALQPADPDQRGAMSASSASPGTTISTRSAGSRRRRSMPTACSTTRSPWNITIAYDARTGARLWTYDPQVPREYGRYACCEPVARGLAMSGNKVIIATLDGRLIALDKTTGKPLWTTQTFADTRTNTPIRSPARRACSATWWWSASRAATSACAASSPRGMSNTGQKRWKFFLTPNDPAKGPDGEASDPIMEMIRKTWSENGMWKQLGGGANPWDSIAYDPANKLVFVGTGNAVPHSRYYRSEDKGDNLFVCSIVALHADDRQLCLALPDGPGRGVGLHLHLLDHHRRPRRSTAKPRQVLMQAPKNGFFYVLDRKTGEVHQRQAACEDQLDARASMRTAARSTTRRRATPPIRRWSMPGPAGRITGSRWPTARAPSWPISRPISRASSMRRAEGWKPQPFRSNSGWGGYAGEALKKRLELQKQADAVEKAWLTAWDPVKQQVAWQVPLPRHGNGGVMVTASDLVFEGTTKQTFAAFDARTGKVLWEYPDPERAGRAARSPTMLDGVQYIAINAGWGGGAAQIERGAGHRAAARHGAPAGVQARRHEAAAAARQGRRRSPTRRRCAPAKRRSSSGAQLFADTCAQCHGRLAIGGVKDLRHMTAETHGKFNDIVLKGIYQDKGMASFADILKPEDAEAIHQYLIARANEDWGRD